VSRTARKKSCTGVYHVISRGVNRQNIFVDREDYRKYLEIIDAYKVRYQFELYAYCIMENHVHLLIGDKQNSISELMRRINSAFVVWYNKKYDRIGNLFQDRYKSEAVENERYFFTVLRYIHLNPVKAFIVNRADLYEWSSYNEYLTGKLRVNTNFALKMLGADKKLALRGFISHHMAEDAEDCLDIPDAYRNNDQAAQKVIGRICNYTNPSAIQNMDKETRNIFLTEMLGCGLSIRQIERLTGINRGSIFALNKLNKRIESERAEKYRVDRGLNVIVN
jgi:REP element-mobilizing transposase RayT